MVGKVLSKEPVGFSTYIVLLPLLVTHAFPEASMAIFRGFVPTVYVYETGVGAVSVAVPTILPDVAVMVVVPDETTVARPLLLIVATDVFDECHVTCVVMFGVVPSE